MGLSIRVRYMYGRAFTGSRSTHVFAGTIKVRFAVGSLADFGGCGGWGDFACVTSVRRERKTGLAEAYGLALQCAKWWQLRAWKKRFMVDAPCHDALKLLKLWRAGSGTMQSQRSPLS